MGALLLLILLRCTGAGEDISPSSTDGELGLLVLRECVCALCPCD